MSIYDFVGHHQYPSITIVLSLDLSIFLKIFRFRQNGHLELVEFMSVDDTARLLLPFSSKVSTLPTSSATISSSPSF